MYVVKNVCIHKVMKQSFCSIVPLLVLIFFFFQRQECSECNYI